MAPKMARASTKRVVALHKDLMARAMTDRSSEWLEDAMFADIAGTKDAEYTTVIERRALAFGELLRAMTSARNSRKTRTFEIAPGELIVGTMPLGSLGLGKVFPNYLTETEKQVAFYCSRGVESNLGHNSPDYTRVVSEGLKSILDTCRSRLASLEIDYSHPMGRAGGILKKIGFYKSVMICCQAVVEYARAFADLADRKAAREKDPGRKAELQKIAAISRRVPLNPAETFHEALQSIWFVHLVLHATVCHLSLGRLDQVLQPYLKMSLDAGEIDEAGALELIECFFIKAAGRLNLNPAYFEKQDHTDFGTSMGHSPFLVDQEVTVNQFMQNIVVGGQTPAGRDATNASTYLFLTACANLGLPTPTVNVRLHKGSPQELIDKVAASVIRGRNGQPVIYNDKTIITGLMQPAVSRDDPKWKKPPSWKLADARDYVVDGCWETLLNGKCDFTYNMVHMLPILECALNGGALLSLGTMQLRGMKKGFLTKLPSEMKSFGDLKEALHTHLKYSASKAGMELYANFCLEGSVTPAPFFSALLGQCLTKGIDKTWGGADHILGGIVFIAVPNVANSLVAIDEWVFRKKKYKLAQVVHALRNNYEVNGGQQMRRDFLRSPKWGNGDKAVDEIMAWLLDEIYDAIQNAQRLADHIFLTIPRGSKEGRRISALRNMASYSGNSMRERYGRDFDIRFTVGCGTFAQYAWFGMGCAATAEGRLADQPVAPNFSPASGTAKTGIGHVLASMKHLRLDRFGCGVMTDLCLERSKVGQPLVTQVIRKHLASGGSILSLTVADRRRLKKIYECCNAVREGTMDPHELDQYLDVTVRVGGWNGVFATLTKAQQEDYLKRSLQEP